MGIVTFVLFVFLVLISADYCLAKNANSSDYQALVALKSAMILAPNSILSTNWTSTTHFCTWFGVSCLNQKVTALQLPGLAIHGRISPAVANLSQLTVLDLSSNDFGGTLPSEMGFLKNLRVMNVSRNFLHGNMPVNISRCRKLQLLYVSDNMFTGSIPVELGLLSELRSLRLNNNNFTGKLSASLGNLSKLEYFYLHENDLQGGVPAELGGLTSLILLSFRQDNFTGSIPASIFNISTLQIVDLSINGFSGKLPEDLGSRLPSLVNLFLDSNRISGEIPVSLSNASKLNIFFLTENDLQGNIPSEFGKLQKLNWFEFEYNRISGNFPSSIFNISALEILKTRHNYLSGHLPKDLGAWLPNLQEIFLSHNRFSGDIPSTICNASKLTNLEVANNSFSGPIPMMLGNLVGLESLNLQNNLLTNEPESRELGFLNSLVNSRNLHHLILQTNPLNGTLPGVIGNLSTNLKVIAAGDCGIMGNIPSGLGNLSRLYYLGLENNGLVGNVPSAFIGLKNLERLYLTANKLEGEFSGTLCRMERLGALSLGENNLSGPVPSCIGNLTEMREMSIAANNFHSTIPQSFWTLFKVEGLNLSKNHLHGILASDVGNLKAVRIMDISSNKFSGKIPNSLGFLQQLVSLDVSRNEFQGPIPDSFSKLVALEALDLSSNTLSGMIPQSLQSLQNLNYLNVSFNGLQGEIPHKGVFANLTYQSLMGNPKLCGRPELSFPMCPTQTTTSERRKSLVLKITIPITVLVMALLLSAWFIGFRKHGKGNTTSNMSQKIGEHRIITYYELLRATESFSESNILGRGSSGTVYKGTLSDGLVVAIKVFNMQWQGAARNFDAECEVLSNVRHRNLVKVISACSNGDFMAIILEFIPNGSLDKWLYSDRQYLSIVQRIDIVSDIAMALEYLHHDYTVPIVHCDLKPSNVLLDEDLVAHIADFGIAKVFAQDETLVQTKTLGTIGYLAPGMKII